VQFAHAYNEHTIKMDGTVADIWTKIHSDKNKCCDINSDLPVYKY